MLTQQCSHVFLVKFKIISKQGFESVFSSKARVSIFFMNYDNFNTQIIVVVKAKRSLQKGSLLFTYILQVSR